MEEFSEILRQLREETDPGSQDLLSMLRQLHGGYEVVMAISQIRSGILLIEAKLEPQEDGYDTHRGMMSTSLETALRKANKAAEFLLEGYAHYCDDLQRCNCNVCKANAAPMN